MFYLQEFTNYIVEHPELLHHPALLAFLKTKDDDRFEKTQKELDKVTSPNSCIASSAISKKLFTQKSPIGLEHVTSSAGQVNCRINGDFKTFSTAMSTLVQEYSAKYTKAIAVVGLLGGALEQAKNLSEQVAEAMADLHLSTQKFNETVSKQTVGQWGTLQSIYDCLQATFKSYSATFSEQQNLLRETVHKPFKYSLKEMSSWEEVLKKREEASSTFYKAHFELEAKKDRLFTSSADVFNSCEGLDELKIDKKELLKNRVVLKSMMFKPEGKQIKNMQMLFAYLNHRMVQEARLFRNLKTKRYIKSLTEFSNLSSQTITEYSSTLKVLKDKLYSAFEDLINNPDEDPAPEPIVLSRSEPSEGPPSPPSEPSREETPAPDLSSEEEETQPMPEPEPKSPEKAPEPKKEEKVNPYAKYGVYADSSSSEEDDY